VALPSNPKKRKPFWAGKKVFGQGAIVLMCAFAHGLELRPVTVTHKQAAKVLRLSISKNINKANGTNNDQRQSSTHISPLQLFVRHNERDRNSEWTTGDQAIVDNILLNLSSVKTHASFSKREREVGGINDVKFNLQCVASLFEVLGSPSSNGHPLTHGNLLQSNASLSGISALRGFYGLTGDYNKRANADQYQQTSKTNVNAV
jgi:hypothetical protein